MSKIQKKIYYHDTDCGGVVYYANYHKYFEEARTECFADKGIELRALTDKGIWFVVKHVDVDYKAPARYADKLDIKTEISKLRNVSIEFSQSISREGQLLVNALTLLVCVDKTFKPMAIPEHLVSLLKK
ncbi:MAG: acyl-CoA thioesterase [Candidatus Omnitrophica bacterium]|nr:acyl-CoA thioesterase [Candidatus Omnitrophota bacterium]